MRYLATEEDISQSGDARGVEWPLFVVLLAVEKKHFMEF